MRLICPNCDAQYEVADEAIPDEGRDVQCSNCGHAWFQLPPAVLEAQAAEAEVFDPPVEMAPQIGAEPAAPALPEPEPEPSPRVAPAARNLDESLVALLKEEAEREAQARAREEPALETQGDLGLEAPQVSAAARRIAQLKGVEEENAADLHVRPAKGRDLLPDIEEINSTLSPAADPITAAPVLRTKAANASFRSGFSLALLVAAVAVAAYVMAPRIAQQMPASADLLIAYVAKVDAARLWLDGLMQRAIMALQG